MEDINENNTQGSSVEIDRVKLKEQRALRKKEKKAIKQLQKQKEREQKELILKLQPQGNNVTLITRDFAEKIGKNSTTSGPNDHNVSVRNATDFPKLGEKCRAPKIDNLPTDVEIDEEAGPSRTGKKSMSKIELADFMNTPSTQTTKQIKPVPQCFENYSGNLLDSDLPVRKRGKFREIPKTKKLSKLKKDMLRDKSEREKSSQIFASDDQLIEQMHSYCDHIITKELNDLTKSFVLAVARLQEKLYKRDPIKGASKRRYIVGFHEVKKHLKLNKVKMLIIAPDIRVVHDGALSSVVNQLTELAVASDVPYLFALKRRLLGTLTMKFIPVSCVAILNYEGLEDQFNTIVKTLLKVKNEYAQLNNINKTTSNTEDDTNTQLLNNLMKALK